MKIKDCKVGMKVRNCWRGEIIKADEEGIISNIEDDYINFEDRGDIKFYPEYFEPVNKFEVGDKVGFNKGKGFNAKIFAIADKEDGFGDKYCITYKSQGHLIHAITKKEHLSPLKKKDELEVGDKFISLTGNRYKIKYVCCDNRYQRKAYTSERISKKNKGLVVVLGAQDIKEIIYD